MVAVAKAQYGAKCLQISFECEVKTLTSEEGPALGVAILAGVGAEFSKM